MSLNISLQGLVGYSFFCEELLASSFICNANDIYLSLYL